MMQVVFLGNRWISSVARTKQSRRETELFKGGWVNLVLSETGTDSFSVLSHYTFLGAGDASLTQALPLSPLPHLSSPFPS